MRKGGIPVPKPLWYLFNFPVNMSIEIHFPVNILHATPSYKLHVKIICFTCMAFMLSRHYIHKLRLSVEMAQNYMYTRTNKKKQGSVGPSAGT